jgi:oligopeptide transport system permease protein
MTAPQLPPGLHPWWGVWYRLTARPSAAAGLVLLGTLILAAALFGGTGHGTVVREPIAQALSATRISLGFAVLAGLLGIAAGLVWAGVAVLLGGAAERRLIGAARGLVTLPLLLLATLAGGLSDRQEWLFLLMVALATAPAVALAVQSILREMLRAEFLAAARASGASPGELLLHHLLPNLAAPLLATGWSALPRALSAESFASLLGLGLREDSWGVLIGGAVARGDATALLTPVLLLALTLWALVMVGDGLRSEAGT